MITEIPQREPRWPDLEYVSLEFPNVNYIFNLSVENTLEDEWIYRIHHLCNLQVYREIPKDMFEGLKANMRITAQADQDGDFIASQNRVNKLLQQWNKLFS